MSIFPQAAGITYQTQEGVEASEFLQTVARSWSENGPMQGTIAYDEGKEQLGPLTIGLALSKEHKTEAGKAAQQRIVVIGDGDFLSNAYLGNQGNQDLGYNILNWLSHDDNFIAIPVAVAPDKELTMSKTLGTIIGLFFLVLLPLLLLASGIYIWLKRRKQ